MLQCSESVYSAVSLTLHHWHTQQSSSTWPSSSSSSGLSQRLLKVCGAQVWYQFISSSILSKFWVDFLLVVFQRVEDRSASLRVPQRQQLDQEKQSKSAVKPAQMCTGIVMGMIIHSGTYRKLEKLLNSWFITQTASSQELHLDSVAVDLTVISLWPSVESRLKMLHIITVWVDTISVVVMCSHSDKESYKNLGQSESRWLNWSCSCSNTITHYWHTETNTATTHELKTELRVKSAPLDCDLSWDRRVRLNYTQNQREKKVKSNKIPIYIYIFYGIDYLSLVVYYQQHKDVLEQFLK